MNVPMIAKGSFHYARRDLRKGQDFEAASESDAHVLETIGHAMRRQPKPNQYQTRVLTAETPAAPTRDLDAMGVQELRTLAARVGVKVHHRAGAATIRQALRNR